MNSEHSAADRGSGIDSENGSGSGSERMGRRRYLAGIGTLAVVGLAGCSGGESESQSGSNGESDSANGTGNATASDENQREAEEQAEDDSDSDGGSSDVNPEDVEQGENLLEYNGLVLNEHESQPYESLDWFSVVGIVENTNDETVDYMEVKVRAYDSDGNQIESVFTNTTDLQAGGTWKFEVTATSDYEEVDDYDIRISDSPF